jgi:hypothetical protein
MNLEPIRELATSKLAKPILLSKIHSPKILFAAGVAGVIGGVVLACRATLQVSDKLDVVEKKLTDLEIRADEDDVDHDPSYSKEQYRKDVSRIKIKLAMDIAKPYVPAIIVLGASIAALTGSHVILTKRNTGLIATVAGLDQALKQYRDRVKETYGEDVDHAFATGSAKQTVTEKLADGTEKKTERNVNSVYRPGSFYAVIFDEKSKRWTPEPGMIPHVLAMLQSEMNDRLKLKGFVYLNEVLEKLDLPLMPAGQHVGWIYTRDPKDNPGDNYITFGLEKLDPDFHENFLDGYEKAVMLDFNVAGPIEHLVSWGDTSVSRKISQLP